MTSEKDARLDALAIQCLKDANGNAALAQALMVERLQQPDAQDLSDILVAGHSKTLIETACRETFSERRAEALKEIMSRVLPGKSVRDSLTEKEVAEIFLRYGFKSSADLQIQEYEVMPPSDPKQ